MIQTIETVVFALACVVLIGCSGNPAVKVMHGSVTCGGEKAPGGKVTFVPIEGSPGRICVAPIVGGQYRMDAGGGVPQGKYCVQVDVRKKTGRKIQQFNGVEKMTADEEVRLGPENYANQHSPLVTKVQADSDGRFNIAIPSK
ncbi:MAG: hypothetical protein JXM70_16935 [Pirellulales bacterium]|nr:hypothetical protein [Pirellulales bacterium]